MAMRPAQTGSGIPVEKLRQPAPLHPSPPPRAQPGRMPGAAQHQLQREVGPAGILAGREELAGGSAGETEEGQAARSKKKPQTAHWALGEEGGPRQSKAAREEGDVCAGGYGVCNGEGYTRPCEFVHAAHVSTREP